MKYYSLTKILNKKAIYNLIIGERSNGKSYAVLEYAIKQFMKEGSQFAYVRRWKEDVIGKRARGVFRGFSPETLSRLTNGKYTHIYYINGEFYLCNYIDNKPVYTTEDLLGFTFALSDDEHLKSTSYPHVKTVMFDEFLTKALYLKDEFIIFMNVLSTIIRRRKDVTIFMLGNTVNKFSPYFQEMGLNNVKEMKQGTIDVYRYGDNGLTVAVEYCSSLESSKENNFYFAFNNPKLEMITGGAWELNIYPHLPIKYLPKEVVFTYFISFDDLLFQCEIVDKKKEGMFTYIHEKTSPFKFPETDLIYTLENKISFNYNRFINRPQTKLQEKIFWFFKTGRVFYQNNSVGDTISNYLKHCV